MPPQLLQTSSTTPSLPLNFLLFLVVVQELLDVVPAICDDIELAAQARMLATRLTALSGTTQAAVKESLRRIVVEHNLDDDDLVESVYGSDAFRKGVAAFIKS